MSDLNKVLLIGRVGGKPEAKKLPSGETYAKMRVATSYKTQTEGRLEEATEWHTVVSYGKLADTCVEHLDKGRLVYIEGRLQSRSWKDKEGQNRTEREVFAKHVHFLGKRPAEGSQSSAPVALAV